MIGLAPERLLIGKVAVVEADFVGGEVTFTAMKGGGAQIVFGPPGAAPDIVLPPAKAVDEPMQAKVNRLLDGLASTFRSVGPGGSLRGIKIEQARLTIIDEGGGARWSADDAAFSLQRNAFEFIADGQCAVERAEGRGAVQGRDRDRHEFLQRLNRSHDERGAAASACALRDAARRAQHAGDAQDLRGDGPEGGASRNSTVNCVSGRGSWRWGGGTLELNGGKLAGRYDLGADTIYLSEVALAGGANQIARAGQARTRLIAVHGRSRGAGAFRSRRAAHRFRNAGRIFRAARDRRRGRRRRDPARAVSDRHRKIRSQYRTSAPAGERARVFWGADGAGKVRAA